jgi:hypothetical protein
MTLSLSIDVRPSRVATVNIHLRVVVALVVVATMGAAYQDASAQTAAPPQRRPEGLFGGIRPDVNVPRRLDFNASLIEGYDEDIPTEAQARIDRSTPQSGGLSTMVNAGASYGWRSARTTIGANAASTVRYYNEVGAARSVGHSAGFGMSTRLPGSVTLFANQAASYSPMYFYGLFPRALDIEPGYAASTLPDYAVTDFYATTYATTTMLRKDINRRSNLTANADYTYTDRQNETDVWRDGTLYRIRGGYSVGTTRNTRLTVGASYRSGQLAYLAERAATEVGVDALWDYSRPLSGTRTLTLTLGLGVAGSDVPQTIQGVDVVSRQYKSVGSIRFGYPVSGTWYIQGNFRRGLEYVMDLPTPVFANGGSVIVEGLLSRRVDVSGSAMYSSGASALYRERLQYDTYAANMRIRYAFSQMFAVHGEYLYYYYDFFGPADPETGLPLGLQRNAVRVGLSMWVPMMGR